MMITVRWRTGGANVDENARVTHERYWVGKQAHRSVHCDPHVSCLRAQLQSANVVHAERGMTMRKRTR